MASGAGEGRRVLVIGAEPRSLIRFRLPLMQELRRRGYAVTAAANAIPPEIAAELERHGIGSRSLSIRRAGMNPLGELRTLASLAGVIRREGPDIVVAYTIKPVIWGSIAARLCGVPRTVAMVTGLGYAFVEGGESKRRTANLAASLLYRLALESCDAVIFQNPDDRDHFVGHRLVNSSKTALVAGSGVDVDDYPAAPAPATPGFLMLARLLRDKGVGEYLRAAEAVKAEHPDVPIRLAGEPDDSPNGYSPAEIAAWGGTGVDYLGPLTDVRPELKQCQVYVLPSYREGTPRSVLEALATGRAVITTDAPGCRETVVDGKNGLLVPPRDAESLAAAMLRLIREPGLAREMGAKSRRLAEEKFASQKVAAHTADIIVGQAGDRS